jgi:prophage maintenance system killer protein
MKDKHSETLRNPIIPINFLTLENLLDINEGIKTDSKRDRCIEYSGSEDYPVKMFQLRKLIEYTPSRGILEIAAYYLKNIVLLQAFPDGNHRTALYSVELFLLKNGYDFNYIPEEAYQFRKELYNRRLREYKTYEEMSVSVLRETDNQVFSLCMEFIKAHAKLSQNN